MNNKITISIMFTLLHLVPQLVFSQDLYQEILIEGYRLKIDKEDSLIDIRKAIDNEGTTVFDILTRDLDDRIKTYTIAANIDSGEQKTRGIFYYGYEAKCEVESTSFSKEIPIICRKFSCQSKNRFYLAAVTLSIHPDYPLQRPYYNLKSYSKVKGKYELRGEKKLISSDFREFRLLDIDSDCQPEIITIDRPAHLDNLHHFRIDQDGSIRLIQELSAYEIRIFPMDTVVNRLYLYDKYESPSPKAIYVFDQHSGVFKEQ
jgi:hypothetical protein